MRNCQCCHTKLQNDARFCQYCGAKVEELVKNCPHCQYVNAVETQSCANCGLELKEAAFTAKPREGEILYDPIYPLDFRNVKGLGGKIRQYFVVELDKRIKEAHNSTDKEAYLNHLMQSDFQKTFKLRTDQLAEEAYTIHARQASNVKIAIDRMLSNAFEGLLDSFLVKYCQHINEVLIPEAILAYEDVPFGQANRFQMAMDYLAFEEETLDVYTNFLKMPLVKLQNASRYYLFPAKDEKILLICDQTIFGSCKEGFALTEAALYWKAHFKPAQKVYYKELKDIQKMSDHITINGHFFNAGLSLNVKMIYLLKRLAREYK